VSDNFERRSHDDYLRAIARIERAARRDRVRSDLDVVKQAMKRGLPITRAIVQGVTFDLAEKEPKASAEAHDDPPALFHARKKPKVKVVL
jgi:hypothetical protein